MKEMHSKLARQKIIQVNRKVLNSFLKDPVKNGSDVLEVLIDLAVNVLWVY